ncbi:MAG: tRNA (N6-threonylcarbamoyladenosine(37)-N6)-methyltransferase TrmO [Anaerolineae bacterium]|jgi:tRNA-Thr(GGU) m(6)t(6)A37 methyltransferase TsaA|nr:tRNA (N6-threonylcarbamoyladenosine(37)-N6)-methyltransferase TrmO [Anaerolineae bacterium]MBT3714065.1 tRNA (N6-threonylcarbamoyladenosine(37)-N6)-methyltransferase TrmO [Anaerolineae bacterium]MBT4310295.1 tRNA (N6-threonylcarbamoyladenosine(37)-N6)-methyltransferase TrmO [Anaerolineae bacterium]MBT4459778.1 tRNA (N6-threonylcarbamoyladenosine(37)-N6)-methyltransferase TrmO [Anaerolineae bacterium]MBT4840951.1 tRNA (N6-threonylcarbamoyladenosine(37)-N6)-methyltransferase TrmO [Anaerolineae
MGIIFKPIGIIHSPFTELSGMPIQPTSESSAKGHLEIYPEFLDGLKDLDGFSHIYLLYHLHKAAPAKLQLKPFLDDEKRGVFSTRAPRRPNAIGLSLVKIERVEGNFVFVENIDVLNETPLLDIKPYIPEFEGAEDIRTGWIEKAKGKVHKKKSDGRFLGKD